MKFSVEEFLKNPPKYLDSLTVPDIVEFLEYANELYRNDKETVISDDLYDWIEDYVREKSPNHKYFKKVGAPIKEKVLLPEWMGSLDKIRDDTKAVDVWKAKYEAPYVISEKLDGNSGMFALTKSKQIQLFTRGDGKYGQNVSNLLSYIEKDYGDIDSIVKNKKINMKLEYPLLVRGEFIISKDNWEKIKHKGSNARNSVAGILNAKNPDHEVASHLEFVAYELVEPKMEFFEGLDFMKKLGFNVVYHKKVDADYVTSENLAKELITRRKEGIYEIDGVVVRDNAVHKILKEKNPKYAFAYKTILTHTEAEVIVYKVEWNVSKDGLLKPIVYFNPVTINNVKIQKATGFNGSFIETNKIGPGSRIVIIRSGDVIPYILRIVTPSFTGKGSMPEIDYDWSDTHIEIFIKKDKDNDQMKLRQLEHFVNTLNVKHVGEGILKKMFEKGVDTIPKFLALEKKDIMLLDGIQDKGAEKIYQSIRESYKNTYCEQLMVASNLFGRGFGEKRIKAIVKENPDILKQKMITKLNPIEGVGPTIEKQFLQNLPKFYAFLDTLGYKCSKEQSHAVIQPSKEVAQVFKDMSIVFTGFRNKEWEQKVEELGGKMGSGVSKKTGMVVAADKDEDSGKVTKAKELGVTLLSKEEFVKKYGKYGFA